MSGPLTSKMRCIGVALLGCLMAPACDRGDAPPSTREASTAAHKTPADQRSLRRAFDGAPPVIPHGRLGADCVSCHTQTGIQFGEMGFAPPMPHEKSPSEFGRFARCEQCHVFKVADEVFVENEFEGLRQDLRAGTRQHRFAPPVIPHSTFMRGNCFACHTGPAAREEIRCPHPERIRCTQCHVSKNEPSQFARLEDPEATRKGQQEENVNVHR